MPIKLAAKIIIRTARLEAGLTQAQLARRIQVSQSRIAQMEKPSGDLKLSTLVRIAGALDGTLELRQSDAA